MSKPRIAFLGLGIMGSGMARSLLQAGFPLAVYNRNTAKSAPFAEAGARIAETPAQAAADADLVITMVADDHAAREVWLGESGVLASAKTGALCIESSTVSLGWIRELATAAAARGCELIDAPVTGSRIQAAAGELNFLVGGSTEALEKARPALEAMGKSIVPLGPVGSGALLKLVNNFVCGVQIASLAEALAMIERSDLDRDAALGVITNGAPGSPLVKAVSARMTARDFHAPHFLLRLMAKDLSYAIHEAGTLATAEAALALFRRAVEQGHGEKDIAALIESYR
jgi:3-hydroxyisobutyrate dehydrogenase